MRITVKLLGWSLLGLLPLVWFGNDVLIMLESSQPSRSLGHSSRGSVVAGKRLPSSGANFQAYSRLAALLGRNSVHSTLRTVLLEAYTELAQTRPELQFVYGETGWPSGGRFAPHRTHQHGLSVDFMVPLRDDQGRVVVMSTWPWTRFGYDHEFDAQGRLGRWQIDFEAMAAHLDVLDRAARRHNSNIDRLILAPEYLPLLWRTSSGQRLRGRISTMTTPAWVRHDEHYHIDFANPGP